VASSLTWLDYSDQQRRQMLDVIHLFAEQTTRDELGLGSVRDALADILFPGTSTIQTRARYFLFVPWMYRHLENRRIASADIDRKGRKFEVALIYALAKNVGETGIIGIRAKDRVQRLPSNIYWHGLVKLGIRLFPGSQDEYHRSLDGFRRSLAHRLTNDDGEPEVASGGRNWHPALPPAPPDFPDNASFALGWAEAEYLRERILSTHARSLFALLLREARPADHVAFAWEHPRLSSFPAHIREQLEHGRAFSEATHGSALLYNLMLAELRVWPEQVKLYDRELARWWQTIDAQRDKILAWDRRRFWEITLADGARVGLPTRAFVHGWLELTLRARTLREIRESEAARRLIRDREVQLKRSLARLTNPRALELWKGAAGADQLDFRWGTAQRMVEDILAGLREGRAHAAPR
jgi:hypothetical protein